ncbi:MAG: alpha/beta fold hydrolase [Actinobacteria bacterium]|nr:alpha/beta fold hydrolase [Actinomycetota bacterium]
MPVFDRDGVLIHHEMFGDADGERPRVLFLNGSGATLESAAPMIGYLARSCTVLAHDQRGLGRTSVPPGPYSMADYASDAAALLDHVGWHTCAVFGISFGGMVAQEFAVTQPDRVEKMVLFCTSGGGAAGSSYPLHELARLEPAERARRGALLIDTRFTSGWLADHPDDAAIVRVQNERAAAPKSPEQVRGERMQLAARIGHDVADRLGRITSPVLVSAGRFDGIAPVTNGAAIVSRLADASLAVYEGGHAFSLQDHRAMRDAVEFLLSGVRPTRVS